MGSSSSDVSWAVLAAISGGLYLIFDAARYFAQQVSPVTLRRWVSDPDLARKKRWFRYDPRNLHLVSGALLQLSLISAFAATVLALRPRALGVDVGIAVLIWAIVSMIWKFLLALVPDDIGEMLLRAVLPFSHFFYYLFWPVLFPLRRMIERIEKRQEDEAAEDNEQVTEEEVQAFIDVGEDEGILEGGDAQLIQSVVEFGDRVANELMTPRIDVQAFDAKGSLADLARLFAESKYSRIPIYTESIDAITGIVHVKEVFEVILNGETRPVSELARPPFFVSGTIRRHGRHHHDRGHRRGHRRRHLRRARGRRGHDCAPRPGRLYGERHASCRAPRADTRNQPLRRLRDGGWSDRHDTRPDTQSRCTGTENRLAFRGRPRRPQAHLSRPGVTESGPAK